MIQTQGSPPKLGSDRFLPAPPLHSGAGVMGRSVSNLPERVPLPSRCAISFTGCVFRRPKPFPFHHQPPSWVPNEPAHRPSFPGPLRPQPPAISAQDGRSGDTAASGLRVSLPQRGGGHGPEWFSENPGCVLRGQRGGLETV